MNTKGIYVWPDSTWAETTEGYDHLGDDFRYIEVSAELHDDAIDDIAHAAANGATQDTLAAIDLLARMQMEFTQ